jgi:hypothetical protein
VFVLQIQFWWQVRSFPHVSCLLSYLLLFCHVAWYSFFFFFLTRYIENRIYRSLFHFNREPVIKPNSNPPIIFYQGNKSVTTRDPKVDWGTTLWCQELNSLFKICGYLR